MLKDTPGHAELHHRHRLSHSATNTTFNAFYFLTLDDWDERDPKGLTADAIMLSLNTRAAGLPDAQAFAFPPPAIPGVGTSGGITFMLEDRAGKDVQFLAENTTDVPRGGAQAAGARRLDHHA